MPDLKKSGIALLGSGVAGMQNGDPKTTIYTVPPGQKAVVTLIVVRNPTASLAGGTDFDFGDGASADTWKTGVNLSILTGTDDYVVLDNNNSVIAAVFDAGDELGVKPSTGATADAEATIEYYGREHPAGE